MEGSVFIISHPLVQHKLTLIRNKNTSCSQFRQLLREVSMLLAYEVTRDLPLTMETIETPLVTMQSPVIEGKKIVLVSVLRAGNAFLEGMLELIPSARVGHIGLYREPKTRVVVEYYFRVPDDIESRDIIIVDPILATGNSAIAAIHRLKSTNAKSIKFVSLIASADGVAAFTEEHPDVPLYLAAIDEGLDAQGYIVPGLGDAGNRMYATKSNSTPEFKK